MKSISDYPEYQSAVEKLGELQKQLSAEIGRINDLSAKIGRNHGSMDSVTAQAEALLDGEDAPASISTLQRELDEAMERGEGTRSLCQAAAEPGGADQDGKFRRGECGH
ncbi:hypothetical protein [Thiohalobacter thiocyanaticus]|uniref:Uncharacterized protein n=1 Tax=Thiohalobacter thiocyanaticus TaxID=585455 RepID=A0A426QDR3_9GAMM|nr:hypothetical protein [Thiohalobacter thiocyanaticus]RRQ19912.1 hypothetical protein D6C00_14195 [Thiohalobacter thiocyanaticus]